jgi:hypothetical protein
MGGVDFGLLLSGRSGGGGRGVRRGTIKDSLSLLSSLERFSAKTPPPTSVELPKSSDEDEPAP